MYSIDDLLQHVFSDRLDGLRIRIGRPPLFVLDGDETEVEGPAVTREQAEQMLLSVASSRHRRELRENGRVRFIHRFRGRVSFVVQVVMEKEDVCIDIH